MKEGWKKIELGKLAHFESGSRPKGGVGLLKDGVFSLGGEHIGKTGRINIYNPKYVLESYYDNNTNGHINDNDILLCKDGALSGKVALVHGEFKDCKAMINEHVFIIRTESLLQDFLFYYLFSPAGQQQLKLRVSGAAQGGINGTNLKTIPIPFPDNITQQQQIVSELDLLSGVIEKQKAQIDELNKLAQSIFYEMFGDPASNPKGWDTKTLSDISCDKLSYGSGASAISYNGKIRYIRITDIQDTGELNEEKVSPSMCEEKYILNEGDILFARSGATVGKTYCHSAKNGKCIYAGYLIRLIPNIKIVLPSYVFGYTHTLYYRNFIETVQNAVAQPNINAKQYGMLRICIPPLSLQQEFAAKIETIEAMKAKVRQSLKESEQLFNSRMDYYFN